MAIKRAGALSQPRSGTGGNYSAFRHVGPPPPPFLLAPYTARPLKGIIAPKKPSRFAVREEREIPHAVFTSFIPNLFPLLSEGVGGRWRGGVGSLIFIRGASWQPSPSRPRPKAQLSLPRPFIPADLVAKAPPRPPGSPLASHPRPLCAVNSPLSRPDSAFGGCKAVPVGSAPSMDLFGVEFGGGRGTGG